MDSNKLNIAFFNKQLPSDSPNGVSIQVHRLANELSRRGHLVTCYSFSPKPKNSLYLHVQLVSTATSALHKKFEAAIKFRNIDCSKFDIAHYHGDDYLCKGSSKRVRTFYGSALNEAIHAKNIKRFLYQSLFYIFEWVSLIKKGEKAGISKATTKALPLLRNVIHCGVPKETYFAKYPKSENPSILFLGDLNSRKRGNFLIRIFTDNILPQIPNCTLSVVGPEECNGKNINYLGQISESELIKQYSQAHVYCMPSSYEGFGVPAIEAMACNTVVCSVKNAASNEIIKNKVNGIVSTPQQLSKALISILQDDSLKEDIAIEGLNTFSNYFTINKTADSYEKLYNSIVNNTK